MEKSLEVVKQLGILGGLIGLVAAWWSARWYAQHIGRTMNAWIFMKYTERYDVIMESFPPEAHFLRLNHKAPLPAQSDQLRLAVLRYLNLSSEEFLLNREKYLEDRIWEMWKSELESTLRSPLYKREWPQLRQEFDSYPDFQKYVDGIQG